MPDKPGGTVAATAAWPSANAMRLMQVAVGLGVMAVLAWLLFPEVFLRGPDRRAPAEQHAALALMSEYQKAYRGVNGAAEQAEINKAFAPRWLAVMPNNRLTDWRGSVIRATVNEPKFAGDVSSVSLEVAAGNGVVLDLYRGVVVRPTNATGMSADDRELFAVVSKLKKGDDVVVSAEINRIGLRAFLLRSAVVRPAN